MKRRLAAILMYDVVGYSTQMALAETETFERLRSVRDAVIHPLVEESGGRVLKLMGDGGLVEFDSVVDAASCAVSLQEELTERRILSNDPKTMDLRIGLHIGDVIVDGGDLYGQGVNIAARLENLADAGGICISEDAMRQIRGKLPVEFDDLGEIELKGESIPLRVYRVAQRENDKTSQSRTVSLLRKPVVAVIPLKNLSYDPEQSFFVEGLTEDIIGGLSKYSDINVVSRHSSFAATSGEQNVRQIAQSLNARFILSGSVRRQGNRVRVSVELVDAIEDQQVWAERFDREIDDIFEVQDDIVGSILHAVGGADGVLEKLYRSEVKEQPEASFDAYECYLRARVQFYRPEGQGYDEAERLFKKAIEIDPDFARAHSALAWLLFLRFKYHRKVSFASIEKEALAHAQSAIELDVNDYRGYWALAGIYSYQKKLPKSLSSIERALRSNPNDADLLCWSSGIFLHAERTETALSMCQKAIRLNPICPDWYWWELGQVYFQQGRYEETLETLEKMSQLGQSHRLAAAAAAHLGRSNEAHDHAAAFLRLVPNFSLQEFEATEPFQNHNELERYVSGLRLAGLPE